MTVMDHGADNSGTPAARPMLRRLVFGGMVATVLCWGLAPVFQKQLLAVFDPLEAAFTRFFLSGMLMLLFVLATRPSDLISALRRNPGRILATCLLGPVMSVTAFNFGIQTVAIGVASIILALEPILAYLIAVVLGQERSSLARTLSILLCLGGLTLVIVSEQGVGPIGWIGLIAVCLAALIWAVNVVLTKDLVAKEPPLVLTTANLLISTLGLLPFLGGSVLAKVGAMDADTWIALAYCVLPGTVIGYWIWNSALRILSPSALSLWVFAVPIITLISGVALFGETLTMYKSVGVAVMLFGLYLVNVKYKDRGNVD